MYMGGAMYAPSAALEAGMCVNHTKVLDSKKQHFELHVHVIVKHNTG